MRLPPSRDIPWKLVIKLVIAVLRTFDDFFG
jgi:hypothetical protein